MSEPVATVFGWAEALPGTPVYEEGVEIGRGLVGLGYTVRCGGYLGLMEAVARGAREAGGQCEGVTLEAFEGKAGNEFLSGERRERDLFDRLRTLIVGSDLCIAQVGSLGTIAEVAVSWCLRYLGHPSVGPLHLVGREWESVVASIGELCTKPHDLRLATLHTSAADLFASLAGPMSTADIAPAEVTLGGARESIDFEAALERLSNGLSARQDLGSLIRTLGSHAPEVFQHDVVGGLQLQQVPSEIAGLLEYLGAAFAGRSSVRYLEIGLGSCGTTVLVHAFLGSCDIEVELFGVDDLSYERDGWLDQQRTRIEWCAEHLGLTVAFGTLVDGEVRASLGVRRYDVIFVDADHSVAGCLNDVVTALPWLEAEGVLVLHDVADVDSPGVAAVFELVQPIFARSQVWVASDTCGIAALSGKRRDLEPVEALRFLASR